jgi:hypothetical protein
MAPASRSDGSRWKFGAAQTLPKGVDAGHFDFTVPLPARVPGLWNTEERDAVLVTRRRVVPATRTRRRDGCSTSASTTMVEEMR